MSRCDRSRPRPLTIPQRVQLGQRPWTPKLNLLIMLWRLSRRARSVRWMAAAPPPPHLLHQDKLPTIRQNRHFLDRARLFRIASVQLLCTADSVQTRGTTSHTLWILLPLRPVRHGTYLTTLLSAPSLSQPSETQSNGRLARRTFWCMIGHPMGLRLSQLTRRYPVVSKPSYLPTTRLLFERRRLRWRGLLAATSAGMAGALPAGGVGLGRRVEEVGLVATALVATGTVAEVWVVWVGADLGAAFRISNDLPRD
mmetsp:Transcript_35886/g.94064  ORF Transcript_35886/g.94064 Transcript_35886/m.94064 type:complete len:254 (+) Transcript_35886:2195-2956(+)